MWQIRPDMTVERNSRIVIAGAGSIGCYVGGCLALAGRNVTLLTFDTNQAFRARGAGIRDVRKLHDN